MKKILLILAIFSAMCADVFAQEKEELPRIDFNSGVFTGSETAYSKWSINLFEGLSISRLMFVGGGKSHFPDLRYGDGFGFDLFEIGLRPWLDEHRFSIGIGTEFDDFILETDNQFSFAPDGQMIEIEPEPQFNTSYFPTFNLFKITLPLIYEIDLPKHFRVSFSAIPSIGDLKCSQVFGKDHEYYRSESIRRVGFDMDFRLRLGWLAAGIYVGYSPNLIMKKNSMCDSNTLSIGYSVRF